MDKRFSEIARDLIRLVEKSAAAAYAPYSGIRVGAVLYCGPDRIYPGMNIENASFSLCMCAERTALYSALVRGERNLKLLMLYSPDLDSIVPCGACLQVMAEFAPNLVIAVMDRKREFQFHPLATLLKAPFRIQRRQ